MKCYKPIWLQKVGIVPCGRCMACRLNLASSWAQRMMHEKMSHKKTCFVTLTYDENKLPKNGTLVKSDIQKFLKRLRKKVNVRYYIAGEYGELSLRPHYHAILFGVGVEDVSIINEAWQKGFISAGYVTDNSCNYVAGYVTKKLNGKAAEYYKKKGIIPEFALMSRKPGIGGYYVEKNSEEIAERGFCYIKGRRVSLPRYYESKLFIKGTELGFRRNKEKQDYQIDNRNKKANEIKNEGINFFKKEIDERESIMHNCNARINLRRKKL